MTPKPSGTAEPREHYPAQRKTRWYAARFSARDSRSVVPLARFAAVVPHSLQPRIPRPPGRRLSAALILPSERSAGPDRIPGCTPRALER